MSHLVKLCATSLLLAVGANVALGQPKLGGCGRWCGPSDGGIQCQDDLLCEQGEDGIHRCSGCDCEDNGGVDSPGNKALEELSGCGNLCNWFPCKPGLTCTSSEGDQGGWNRCFGSSCGPEGDCGSDCRFFPCRSGLSCTNDGGGFFCTGSSCGGDNGLLGCRDRCEDAPCEADLSCTSTPVLGGGTNEECLGSLCAACGGLCDPSANGAQCSQKESCVQSEDGVHRCAISPIGYLAGGEFGGCDQWCGPSDNGLLCQRSLSCDQGEDGIFRCSGSWCGSDGGGTLGGCFDGCGPSDNGRQCQDGLRCESLYDGSSFTCKGSSCAPPAIDGGIGAGCGFWCGLSSDNDIQCRRGLTCSKGRDGIFRCAESCIGGGSCGFRDLGALVGSLCGPDGGRCRLGLQCAKDIDGIYKCTRS